MSSNSPAQARESWEGRPTYNLANLREVLTKYTKRAEDMTEISLEGERPVVIRRTDMNDVVIEVSAAYKSGMSSVGGGPELLSSAGDKKEELKQLFKEIEAPAVTTEEVANRLNCPQSEAIHHLTEFDHRGWINHRQSGDTSLWWPVEDDFDTDSSDILPEYIEEGLEQSKRDIREWIRENKRDDESLQEAHERIRGNPSPEEVKELLRKDEAGDSGNMMEAIKQKRKSSKNRKNELQQLFE